MKIKKHLLAAATLLLLVCTACSKNVVLKFKSFEATIKSGEAITILEHQRGVEYNIINNPYADAVKIDKKTGKITFPNTIPNYTQIMVVASYEGKNSMPCIVTLMYDYQDSSVSFTNLSSYIASGDYVNAISNRGYTVHYSLKDDYSGITIDEETGKVSFAPIVKNNTSFKVIADSHGSISEHEFIAMTEGFVTMESYRQAVERSDSHANAIYPINFKGSELQSTDDMICVVDSLNKPLDSKDYSFNKEKGQLLIHPSYKDKLKDGENIIKLVTKRNTISLRYDVATRFIVDAEGLASIDDTNEGLSGYYILMNDIDLSTYLSKSGAGYNDGKGWTAIGDYDDVTDINTATKNSFKGTFDGNGHVIRNLYMNRKDKRAFNAGLFGYCTSASVIKNLGVEGDIICNSYSGGFVGSNSGVIENCYANVNITVYSGGDNYRFVGGFVGNNFGTIKNCYSLGDALCDKQYGSFAGTNEGVLDYCYAAKTANSTRFQGNGIKSEHTQLFESLEELKAYDFKSVFPESEWEFKENEYPTLKSNLKEYALRGIKVLIEDRRFYVGDSIVLDSYIFPEALASEYKDLVKYEIIGEGYELVGDTIKTDNAKSQELVIKASLMADGRLYTDTKTIHVRKRISSLTIGIDSNNIVAGKKYEIKANFEPNDANEEITYHISGSIKGARIEGNILYLDDEFNYDKITIYAQTENGTRSNMLRLTVNKQLSLKNTYAKAYESEDSSFRFEFNKGFKLTGATVECGGQALSYRVEDNFIVVDKAQLKNKKDQKLRFVITLSNGMVFGCDGYYFSHKEFNEANVAKDVIKIYTAEDWFKYFNTSLTAGYDKNKLNNYGKKFILMADIDFKGQEIYAIGYEGHEFSGEFYGNGHTISNFVIKKNELFATGDSLTCYYGVGLFGMLTGKVYDLTIRDAKVEGKNFAGSIVGMLTTGYVENCFAYNVTVMASEYQESQDGITVGKIVGKQYEGKTLCIYCDDSRENVIG